MNIFLMYLVIIGLTSKDCVPLDIVPFSDCVPLVGYLVISLLLVIKVGLDLPIKDEEEFDNKKSEKKE